ncbi:MAG: hypothetical protein KHX56_06360, partial [Clostridiales bacterium]|nr:hypothetical protein [Clostridiales bacterium]
NAPLWIALRRNGSCRLRDPPQAENPAKQDSFLLEFNIAIWLSKTCVFLQKSRQSLQKDCENSL